MTADQPTSADESFDDETFQTELSELTEHACEADVDIGGAYSVQTPWPNHSDYTIEITGLTNHD